MVCAPAEDKTGQVGTSPAVCRTAVAVQVARQFRLQVPTRLFSSTRQGVHSFQKTIFASIAAIAANIIGTSARSQIEFALITRIFSTDTDCTHVVQVQRRACVRAAAGEIATGTFKVIELIVCGFGQIAGTSSSTTQVAVGKAAEARRNIDTVGGWIAVVARSAGTGA